MSGDEPILFLSWSQIRSKNTALILKDFLSKVLPGLEIFMSENDISKGAKGLDTISKNLEKAIFGVVCLTKENINSPWVNFEAGALSKHVSTDRVSPFLLDVEIADIGAGPLSQFQATFPDKQNVKQLIESIADQSNLAHVKRNLSIYFDQFWPDFEKRLSKIPDSGPDESPEVSGKVNESERKLNEVTRQLHSIMYKLNSPENLLPEKYLVTAMARANNQGQSATLIFQVDEMRAKLEEMQKNRKKAYEKFYEIYQVVENIESRIADSDVSIDIQSDVEPDLFEISSLVKSGQEILGNTVDDL